MKNVDLLIHDFINKDNLFIQNAQIDDISAVEKIAYYSFKGYGHYAADNRLDKEKSNDIYVDWARKSCIDKSVADHMFVAKIGNQVAGFLSLKTILENDKSYGIQHLGAIDKEFRNFNVFKLLILTCLKTGIDKKHNWQQTFLLSTNMPVIRSYIKMGFKISG